MKKYYIQDWAGNDKTDFYGEFNSFEDAWAALHENFNHLDEKSFEDQMGEFEVLERGAQ
jgi:hypothetical protein